MSDVWDMACEGVLRRQEAGPDLQKQGDKGRVLQRSSWGQRPVAGEDSGEQGCKGQGGSVTRTLSGEGDPPGL